MSIAVSLLVRPGLAAGMLEDDVSVEFEDGPTHIRLVASLGRHAYGEGMPLETGERRRFGDARIARLATTRPDGRPHVVPITFALRGETIVTAVDQKPKTTTRLQRLKNIAAQPAASVLVDHYEDDWSQLWWVRADGTARVVTEGTEWRDWVEVLTKKYAQYGRDLPRGPLIVLSVGRWTSWTGR